MLQDFTDTADDEIRDFLQMVTRYINDTSSSSSSSSRDVNLVNP